MSKSGSQVISSGVDELINRLRQDGIDAGKQQAQQLHSRHVHELNSKER